MQFMIECYQDKSLQKDSISHKDKSRKQYHEDIEKLLHHKAVKRGIKFGNKETESRGLKGTNIEKFCDFIQESKDL